ncbi:molybdopterin molybdotransferase MoeA [Cytobacillus horneckiae]|uniref:Molybdopterin molybdenumtransferase n=1 Tax=Cytobacillus horneckiae TaxID=549687 RepID=A0A2N0ZB21_9BACI|nr:gephyrin-like molybdotransferase Glp [Cytobacillus horneckiae]MEC1155550.1 molybdopterin molybdotransferase MoeA [Cytobacillus horneckiae]MED2936869.1 molybdopterin molybdotransferase MoeA [Cytobacillus horneckiae]PKG26712.1 molybdopterin molybdenumtransferase MoeA [Cytobacillus horneckiae]
MVEKRTPIPVKEAVKKVMDYKVEGNIEFVSILHSNNRFLAQDLTATSDVPHFDRSPYDGFAVRSIDTQTASLSNEIEFEVVDHIGAGFVSEKQIGPFQAVRIMTGAQIPEDCDAVVMLELAKAYEKNGRNYMSIKRSYQPGDNVSFKGEDAKTGDALVEKGTKINPGIQAILATFGYAEVPVVKKPLVGLFATGTELLEVEDELQPGKIRNSNSTMLAAQIERAGAEVKYFGKLPDEFDTCYEAVKSAVNEVDMLITTGGVSVGDFDYLPAIYEKMKAEVLFNKVAMRPGSVTTVAQLDGKLLFGLSGNPSACYVGFELFTRPIIRHMLYSKKPHLRKEKAILKADFPKANPFTRFVRATVSIENGKLVTSPSGVDKSNIVMSLAGANALMLLPGGTRGYGIDDEVDVFMLEDFVGSEWPW